MVGIDDISIIVPVYCKTDESLLWLDECLASAVGQGTFVSIYDDGSVLDIEPVVSKYIRNKHVIYNGSSENRGVSYARNQAVRQSNTILIFPLDCDDILVDDAMKYLLINWDGTPIYPDIEKFGKENVPHYTLLDFHCDHLYNHIGFTSVNVLHYKAHWSHIGGWDEGIKFYEDGEYNARLLGTFCGKRYPRPLVRYRIHDDQRTELYKKQAHDIAKELRNKIRSYDMACPGCSKRKSTTNSSVTGSRGVTRMANLTGRRSEQKVDINSVTLPIEFEGKVLVQYRGGNGRGRHYYKGLESGDTYKVVYGDIIYADPRDSREESDTTSQSMLVRIYPKNSQKPQPQPVPQEEPEEEKSPRVSPEKTPVEEVTEIDVELVEVELDPSDMTIDEIKAMDLTPEEAEVVLEWEKEGKNRVTLIEYLEEVISG